MSEAPFFPDEEYETRLRNVRGSMAERDLDACLVSTPEHIYYLTGLSHWGYFAYHMLVVPPEGEMYLIARAMERVIMHAQLVNARFIGYGEREDQAEKTCEVLADAGFASGRLGIEKNTIFLPLGIAEGIKARSPDVQWTDASDLVFQHRAVQSPRELEYTRRAAAVTDAMMRAAIDTAAAGVSEQEVAAEVHHAMVSAGGEYPAYGPFIRSTPTLGYEHGTWTDRVLEEGDAFFLEMSGSVARYHAPMGRLVFVGEAPEGTREIEQVCLEAFDNVVEAIGPGVTADDVYQAWQDRVDAAGLSHYRRHHCGYLVGSAFPPSWSGAGVPVGLRHNSDFRLRAGMVFHLMSWLMGSGRGDYFVSDAAVVTEAGCKVLTGVSQQLHVV